jgi:hypothetical protein
MKIFKLKILTTTTTTPWGSYYIGYVSVVVACANDVFSYVHSYLLESIWWFFHGGMMSFFWSLQRATTPTTTTNQQQHDVFLYIRKPTFCISFIDVFNKTLNFVTLPPTPTLKIQKY